MATVAPTQSDIFTALRAFLVAILPAGVVVQQGQANRVAEPGAPDFVLMTPTLRRRLATNVDLSIDGGAHGSPSTTSTQRTEVTVQLDVHGPNGADNAEIITTMLRSAFGSDLMAAAGIAGVSPLYAADPRQTPFVNAAAQYEFRWTVDAVLQVDQTVTTTGLAAISPGFATSVSITPQPPIDASQA